MAATVVLAGHQPAYLPWCGYLSRMLDVDRFLILDHVQYSGSWQHRNYVHGPNGRRRLTVPVAHRFGQTIHQARISGDAWRGRHWRILTETYHCAAFWLQWEPRLAAIYQQPWERLADLNQAVLDVLLEGFGIEIMLLRSSTLRPANRRTAMLIDLCRLTGSNVLRVGGGAVDYLDFAALAAAGIGVQVATYSHPPYARGRLPFVAGLSAVDLLLHQGPNARRILAEGAQTYVWSGREAMSA